MQKHIFLGVVFDRVLEQKKQNYDRTDKQRGDSLRRSTGNYS